MKNMMIISILMVLLSNCARVSTNSSLEQNKDSAGVVYVSDSRKEITQISDAKVLTNSKSNVALIGNEYIHQNGNSVTLSGTPLTAQFNLCPGQKYAEQQSIANCTGILISPKYVLTAGHCLNEDTCNNYKMVFDFKNDSQHFSPESENYNIPAANLFSCKKIAARVSEPGWTKQDYTIIELDRPVTGRASVKFATRSLKEAAGIYTLGYPLGVALKYAHGRIREDMNSNTYKAAIDTFAGNSGSPVYDEQTHTLIGLLSGGEGDMAYNPQYGCNMVKVCTSGSCLGERVFKTSSIAPVIKKFQ